MQVPAAVGRYWAICVCAVLVLPGCGRPASTLPEPVRPVRFFTVEPLDALRHRSFPGVVEAARIINLSFRVAGTVQHLSVMEGDRVEEGDIIAWLDPRDYDNAVEGVESALEAARAELSEMLAGARPEDIRVLEAQVQSAQAQATKAETDHERAVRLYESNAIARAELDALESVRDASRAQLAAARANLEAGQSGARPEQLRAMQSRIRGLEAQLAEVRDAREDTALRAPFTGTVTRRIVDNFDRVPAGQPIVTLQDLDAVEIAVQVPERDFAQAPSPEWIEFVELYASFEAVPNLRLPLRLKEFQLQADPVTQTYRVTFEAGREGVEQVTPGMTAQVHMGIRLLAVADDSAVLVPVEAVFGTADGGSAVWIIDPGTQRVRRQSVTVGSVVVDRIEVLEGLPPGAAIAASGVTFLTDGMAVRPMSASAP